jgi:hypothetical protein
MPTACRRTQPGLCRRLARHPNSPKARATVAMANRCVSWRHRIPAITEAVANTIGSAQR